MKREISLCNSLMYSNFSSAFLQAWLGVFLVGIYVLTEQKVKAVYLAPLFAMFLSGLFFRVLEGHWNFSFTKQLFIPFTVCFSLSMLSMLVNFDTLILAISGKEVIIIFGSILFLTNKSKPSELQIKFLFICFIFGFFLTNGNYQRFFMFFSTFNPLFLILPSDGAMEYDLGAALGLFSLYFLLRKKWIWFLFSMLLIVLASKRVVILALVVSISYTVLVKICKVKFRQVFILPIVFAFVFTSFFIVEIATYIKDFFDLSIPVSRLLMGRDSSAIPLRNGLIDDSLFSFFFGHGPGSSNICLGSIVSWSDGTSALPHNDYLKILYDYGIVGFITLFILFFRLFALTPIGIVLFVYTLAVFAFDNALIFAFHLIPLGLMSRIELPNLLERRVTHE